MTSPETVTPLTPIEPLAATRDGVYRDGVVEVRRCRGTRPRRELRTVRTAHFDVTPHDGCIRVWHDVPTDQVDDDLAGKLDAELFGPGWLRGSDLFERIFTGVVVTSAADPEAGWELFYRNTLDRLAEQLDSDGPGAAGRISTTGHGTLADYAPVYRRALSLLPPGSVLELGCCFGFLSLLTARTGRTTIATDVNPGTMSLLGRIAPRLGVPLQTVTADAARLPLPEAAAETVFVIHLLEHLDDDHGARVLAEALRLARRRVVVAVPLEDVANETWGHVRTISLADLECWGVGTGLPFEVSEYHGGWLVLDRTG